MIFESVRLSLVLSMSRQAAATVIAELRQKPALLRVLRNSPRAMPLSGLHNHSDARLVRLTKTS